jgi:hypothetical protein
VRGGHFDPVKATLLAEIDVKAIKIIVILALVYVGIVVLFESMLGYFQPENQSTLIITTTDKDGVSNDRVLVRLDSNEQLYVSANHWPRAWYHQALENPNVQVVLDDGKKGAYLAVPVTGEEHDRVDRDNKHGIGFRILVGFAPRYFVRLDPR